MCQKLKFAGIKPTISVQPKGFELPISRCKQEEQMHPGFWHKLPLGEFVPKTEICGIKPAISVQPKGFELPTSRYKQEEQVRPGFWLKLPLGQF
ncbi:MAG: hypothetical protein K2N38_13665 [Oscillospiraceae bacterium]|nr:hypothetical protein [Oscillospiraceae bacterium]